MKTSEDLKGYKKLKVWQEAHKLVLLIYRITKKFPKEELFSLTNQIRRAAVSIPANIVEGYARASKKEFMQFLSIARGSLAEVEYYLELAKDLDYVTDEEWKQLFELHHFTGALLSGLMKSLR